VPAVPKISIHDHAALNVFARQQRIDPQYLRRLRIAFYKKQQSSSEALQQIPAEKRPAFASVIQFHALELESRHDSRIDGATKLVFRTASGHLLESVILRIATGRTTLCLSSQSGCAAACGFCATGKMGLGRSLTAPEILDQVIHCGQILLKEERCIRNIVFMGMGEPFHNEENLGAALDVLSAKEAFNFSEQRLLVSTVGVPDAMIRFAKRRPKVRLALSLHSARQKQRERLIPLAKRHSLDDLYTALETVTRLQGEEVMIEYLLLKDFNDTPDDLQALQSYLKGIPVHINLIPYNPIEGAPELVGTNKPEREAFAAALKRAGFKVTLRYSLGADIAAACGQLVKERGKQPNSVP
jgi:23S rRNA (adenine2503-C2)-methyltransferase